MALEFADGFDGTGANSEYAMRWDSGAGIVIGAGRYGGNIIGGTNALIKTLTPAVTRTIGAAFKSDVAPAAFLLMGLRDGGTFQVEARLTTTGALTITRNATVLATSSNVIRPNTWYYIELQGTIDPTTGYAELRVNGTQWASFTGNTRTSTNSYSTTIYFGTNSTNIDDVYSRNDSTFMGEVRIDADLTSAEGDTLNWTPNTLTVHYNRVNEATCDSDTTYNSDSTVGNLDLYKFTSRTINAANTIAALVITYIVRKDDAGARSVAEQCKSGGTIYTGATQVISASYLAYQEIRATNPNGGGAWGGSDIGASGAQFGVKTIS